MVSELTRTQWLTSEALRDQQLRQLRALVAAARASAYWAGRIDGAGLVGDAWGWSAWRALPILSRDAVRRGGSALDIPTPKDHGAVQGVSTSGSTGRQVEVRRTALSALFWDATTVRDVLWHRRDPRETLAAIRYVHDARVAPPPNGATSPTWGAPASLLWDTGPAHLLSLDATPAEQAAWLREVRPRYLTSHPTNLLAVLGELGADAAALGVDQILPISEAVSDETRAALASGFAAQVVDVYSAQEVGNIASQCPSHAGLHVHAEDVLVEVLDAQDRPCAPGEVGRVVVTPLHNFATLLLRYELGDYAEVGQACPCGRGLPVLRRVLGRQRHMMVLPNGARVWPFFKTALFGPRSGVAQFQIVQREVGAVVARLVLRRPLSVDERAEITTTLVERVAGVRVTIEVVDEIPRGAGGKFEDFRCEL